MSNDRHKRDSMSLEKATVSNMWEIAAIAGRTITKSYKSYRSIEQPIHGLSW